MGSHVVCQKVTGASPNSSSNPTPISSSVLNGESPSEPDTQSNVPVIKVNGRWTQRIKCYDCMDDDTLEENKPTRLTQLSVNRSWHVFVKIFPYQGCSWPFLVCTYFRDVFVRSFKFEMCVGEFGVTKDVMIYVKHFSLTVKLPSNRRNSQVDASKVDGEVQVISNNQTKSTETNLNLVAY